MIDFTYVMIIVLSVCVALEFVFRMINVFVERKQRELVVEVSERWIDYGHRHGLSHNTVTRALVFVIMYGHLPNWASKVIEDKGENDAEA